MTQMCSRHFLFMYKYRWETTSTIDKIKWKNWNQDLSPKPAKKKSMIIQEQYSVRIKKKKRMWIFHIRHNIVFVVHSFIHSRSRNLSIYFRLFFSLSISISIYWFIWINYDDDDDHTTTRDIPTHTHIKFCVCVQWLNDVKKKENSRKMKMQCTKANIHGWIGGKSKLTNLYPWSPSFLILGDNFFGGFKFPEKKNNWNPKK